MPAAAAALTVPAGAPAGAAAAAAAEALAVALAVAAALAVADDDASKGRVLECVADGLMKGSGEGLKGGSGAAESTHALPSCAGTTGEPPVALPPLPASPGATGNAPR